MRRTLLASAAVAAALAAVVVAPPSAQAQSGIATAANGGSTADAPSPYSAKARQDVIYQAQLALNKQGFGAGTPDGIMGRNTRKAVESFQYSQGMQPTGRLTDGVLDKLGVDHAPNQFSANTLPAAPATRVAPRRGVRCADFLHQNLPGGTDYHGPPVPGCN